MVFMIRSTHSARIFKYSQKNEYGKVPDYIVQRKKEAEEAQREYDAYIQVLIYNCRK